MRPNWAGNQLITVNPDERRDGNAAMTPFLDWLIPRQPSYPVEVGIVTGEVGETMGLHDRDDERITHELLMLLTHGSCSSTRGGVMATVWIPKSGICATAWT
jgi:hypothetical protein